jgi:hypothetical protein
MSDDFELILDKCVDRINRGDSPEDCLSDYPAYADRLRPLLMSMRQVQNTYGFTPSVDAKRAARQKLHAALDQRQQVTPTGTFFKLFSRPAVWIPVAVAALVLIIIGIWGFGGLPGIQPGPGTPVLVSNPEGNFAFLISDEPNDIGDFTNLNVTISKVGLQSANNSGDWIEFVPDINIVDLTQLQGEQSQEIWRGNVPAGRYSQIFIYVSQVVGNLTATGQTIDVKLPSNKLHISQPFEVTSGKLTSFTFDITVIATGKSGKYILKPQISESGAK